MASIRANGIDIEYETHGDPANETVLLVMGFGMQLIHWREEFVDRLVDRGYHVVRFDNRDAGLSTKFDGVRPPNAMLQMLLSRVNLNLRTPYTLDDMAQDAVGLLEALAIDKAHVVGASMGGMIAQIIAARHAHRVLSLTSMMSTTGHPSLPRSEPEALRALMTPPSDPSDRQAILAQRLRVQRVIGSPAYPTPEPVMRERAIRALDRSYYPAGLQRQMAAIIASPHRRRLLRQVTVPASVVHGEADPLVNVECGYDTARHLPDAEMFAIPGMGHDLPSPLIPTVIDAIDHAAARSRHNPAPAR